MAAIANGIDFLLQCFTERMGNAAPTSELQSIVGFCWAGFLFLWFVILGHFSDSDFSTIMTAGAAFQFLGFVILCAKVHATKSVEGLSSRSLELFVMFYCTRLTTTLVKNGYIPVDRSGDFMYQAMDLGSLGCCLHLLFRMHKTYLATYQEEHDELPLMPMVPPCFLLACFVYGDFNRNRFFDTVWAASLNLETLTMLPQLAMLAKIGGKVDATTGHFVACMVLSAVCRFEFWYYAHGELESPIARTHVMVCHGLQLLLCADFMFYYAKAWVNGTSIVLPNAVEAAPVRETKAPRRAVELFDEDGMPCSWR
jgi:hypothetical protein